MSVHEVFWRQRDPEWTQPLGVGRRQPRTPAAPGADVRPERTRRALWRRAASRAQRWLGRWEHHGLSLDTPILLGTHHKTGTVWLGGIFREISERCGLQLDTALDPRRTPDVLFRDHSDFDFDRLPVRYRGLHVIRDPRDVIVSATFYHRHSSEPWLHVRRRDCGGRTYQEKINSYEALDDQLLFEMEHESARTIRDMLAWDYARPGFVEAKYEELIADRDLFLFHQIFTSLGFPGRVLPELLRIAHARSLFSGNVRSAHVRSGRSAQWREYFRPVHEARFARLFPDALARLGY